MGRLRLGNRPNRMKSSLEKKGFPRRVKAAAGWLMICLSLCVLSAGPVAWATNDGLHPRYLPEAVNVIYLPRTPLMQIERLHQAFHYYTVIIWGGWPAGYTTL